MKRIIKEEGRRNRIKRHASLVPINNFAQSFLGRPFGLELFRALREPGLDIIEKDNKVIVKAEVPEIEEKDIKVRIDGDVITISGEKTTKREIKKEGYYYLEEKANSIQRSAKLPEGIAKGSKRVHYKTGILTVEFNKRGGVSHEKN